MNHAQYHLLLSGNIFEPKFVVSQTELLDKIAKVQIKEILFSNASLRKSKNI